MKSFGQYSGLKTEFGIYEGVTVPLERPMIEFQEEKDPELNSPKRSDDKKKYVVYVKNPDTGNIKRIEFGDEKPMQM